MAKPDRPKRGCFNCVYYYYSLKMRVAAFAPGFPALPLCSNHPDAPGELREVFPSGICRNYHPKPPAPAQTQETVRRIPLTLGQYALVDAADYEWLSQHKWACSPSGYAARQENGKTIFMHRQIMNAPAGMVVDHIDNSRHNNCRGNLRLCTRRQNLQHLVKHHNCTSRFKGVRYCQQRHKWYARAEFEGERFWLGSFDDEIEAARTYDRLAVELFGEFAYLNFPEEWPLERRQEAYAKKETMQAVRAAKAERMKRRKRTK
jgi:hypothetical protein